MGRTKGSKDSMPRKVRHDKGKSRTYYRGKPIVRKRKVRSERRIGKKTHIKVWVWERKPMTREGFLHFNPKIRHNVYQKITRMLNVHYVSVEEISTKEKIQQFMADNYWTGEFLIMGFSNAKNKYRCKPVKLCRVIVRERPEGNKAKMINNYRLHRYAWFYKG